MAIRIANLAEVLIHLVGQGGLLGLPDYVSVRVPFSGKIVSVHGTLATGTGITTLQLNRLRGTAKAVVGTVNVEGGKSVAMAALANVQVVENDVLTMDVTAVGTAPSGASLNVVIRRNA